MKTLKFFFSVLLVLCLFTAVRAQAGDAFSVKGEKIIGFHGLGYYEINSDWQSLYYNFSLAGSTKTAGFGFGTSLEIGFTDRISGELDLGYSRLTYTNRQQGNIKESYFVGDVLGHFYFLNSEKVNPYLVFGVGAVVSSGSVAPVGDLGVGIHFRIIKEFSIKTEIIAKSAVIYNRGEARLGVAYHF